MIDFLHYVEHSTEKVAEDASDERIRRLHRKISNIKSSEQIGVTYMKMEERDRLIKKEGYEEGELYKVVEQVRKKLEKDLDIGELRKRLFHEK